MVIRVNIIHISLILSVTREISERVEMWKVGRDKERERERDRERDSERERDRAGEAVVRMAISGLP